MPSRMTATFLHLPLCTNTHLNNLINPRIHRTIKPILFHNLLSQKPSAQKMPSPKMPHTRLRRRKTHQRRRHKTRPGSLGRRTSFDVPRTRRVDADNGFLALLYRGNNPGKRLPKRSAEGEAEDGVED